jgi:hypothetical protein
MPAGNAECLPNGRAIIIVGKESASAGRLTNTIDYFANT